MSPKTIFLPAVFIICTVMEVFSQNNTKPCPCCGPEYRQFDFWVGEWDVYNPKGEPAGRNRISLSQDSCMRAEHWESAKGNYTGISYNYYDAASGKWRQTWVDNKGGSLLLSGNFLKGKMVLDDRESTRDTLRFNRITWTPNPDGTVRQHWEKTNDGGQTMTPVFDGLYRPRPKIFYQDVSWSPDGKKIAYSRYRDDVWTIYIANPDGSGEQKIVQGMYVAWSPDGSRLAFSSDGAIKTCKPDGSDVNTIPSALGSSGAPAWSADGKYLAYHGGLEGQSRIYVSDADGKNIRSVTDGGEGRDYNPAWHPVENKLVFYRSAVPGQNQLYIVQADGSGLQKITNNTFNNIFPAWSPDGKNILYGCGEVKGGEDELHSIDPATGTVSRIGDIRSFWGRLSPDGKKLAFVTGKWPYASIYTANADGSDVQRIVR